MAERALGEVCGQRLPRLHRDVLSKVLQHVGWRDSGAFMLTSREAADAAQVRSRCTRLRKDPPRASPIWPDAPRAWPARRTRRRIGAFLEHVERLSCERFRLERLLLRFQCALMLSALSHRWSGSEEAVRLAQHRAVDALCKNADALCFARSQEGCEAEALLARLLSTRLVHAQDRHVAVAEDAAGTEPELPLLVRARMHVLMDCWLELEEQGCLELPAQVPRAQLGDELRLSCLLKLITGPGCDGADARRGRRRKREWEQLWDNNAAMGMHDLALGTRRHKKLNTAQVLSIWKRLHCAQQDKGPTDAQSVVGHSIGDQEMRAGHAKECK